MPTSWVFTSTSILVAQTIVSFIATALLISILVLMD